MMLHDLAEQLAPEFPPSIRKDLKTAIRVLARALNCPDPTTCPMTLCLQPLATIYQTVETYLTAQGKGPHTIRTVKNNLSRLFRLAEIKHLFTPVPAVLTQRFSRKGYIKSTTGGPFNTGLYFTRQHWSPELDAEFRTFVHWATAAVIENRDAKYKKRLSTIRVYQNCFEAYFGYLHHILHIEPITFAHLFNFSLIKQFTYWHINELYHRPTHKIHVVIQFLRALNRQYHPNSILKEQLKELQESIPKPPPFYDKGKAWVPLREIERVGLALWPTKNPESIRGNGRCHAVYAGLSLIFRLWVHVPYRSRNIREMRLDENLYQDTDGHWRIRFAGEQLKVAMKRGRHNVFDLPFPPTLVPDLHTYLAIWRPLLTPNNTCQEVFLGVRRQPYKLQSLNAATRTQIYAFTGNPSWHPHLMRTIWTTEWIQSGGDFMTAAIMLNDRLETVIAKYSHLRDENVAEKAYEWVQHRVNRH